MKLENKIELKNLSKSLITREAASVLIEKLMNRHHNPHTTIILDLKNIDFMSRSFADQLHKEIKKANFNRKVTFRNANNSILETLRVVERTQHTRKLQKKVHRDLSFSSILEIKDYLHTL